jgi:hypothetical protein
MGKDITNFAIVFVVHASVGWSADPRRWPLKLSGKDDPVLFHTERPLLRDFQVLGPVFDHVNLDTLTNFIAPEAN